MHTLILNYLLPIDFCMYLLFFKLFVKIVEHIKTIQVFQSIRFHSMLFVFFDAPSLLTFMVHNISKMYLIN